MSIKQMQSDLAKARPLIWALALLGVKIERVRWERDKKQSYA